MAVSRSTLKAEEALPIEVGLIGGGRSRLPRHWQEPLQQLRRALPNTPRTHARRARTATASWHSWLPATVAKLPNMLTRAHAG